MKTNVYGSYLTYLYGNIKKALVKIWNKI